MTKCLCTGMIYDPEMVAKRKAAEHEAERAAAKKGSWWSRIFGK